MLEVNGLKKDIQQRLADNYSPGSRPLSKLEGCNYSFYDPDYCWEPFFKYFADETHSKFRSPSLTTRPSGRKLRNNWIRKDTLTEAQARTIISRMNDSFDDVFKESGVLLLTG